MTGTTLSHYRVLERLGEGATAVVYKAEDLALGRPVALKLLPQSVNVDLGKIARFQHEARTTSTLNHPNICTIYEVSEHEGRHFIAMEYLEGRPLSQVIEARPVESYRLIELAIQIADGLDAAHEARVIHRDLKPANIYVTQRDHVKLLDFGLATLLPFGSSVRSSSSASWLSEPGGTGPYMSPEQTLGEPLDTRSDLFSFGVVLYEMATGSRPFAGGTHAALVDAIRHERAFPARDLNTDVRDELDRIINKALEKNRKLRYQTASDMSADLRRLKRDLDAGVQVAMRTPPQAGSLPADALEEQPRREQWVGTGWLIAQLIGAAAVGGTLVALGLPATGTSAPTSRAPGRPATDVVTFAAAPTAAPALKPVDPPVSVETVAPTSAAPHAQATREAGRAVAPARVAAPASPPIPPAAIATERRDAPTGRGKDMTQALRSAQAKADLKLYDQALDTLREAIRSQGPSADAAPYLLMADIQSRQGHTEDAIATYLDISVRHPDDPSAPEALFRMGDAILHSRHDSKETEAAKVYTTIASSYQRSAWAPRALMARAALEERRRRQQPDAVLGRSVPAALPTYRELVERFPGSPEREHALWKLSSLYLDLKRFDLAAAALIELAGRYPQTAYDAWFTAAEIYQKQLNEPDLARSAYAQVPQRSPRWDDAQKRLASDR